MTYFDDLNRLQRELQKLVEGPARLLREMEAQRRPLSLAGTQELVEQALANCTSVTRALRDAAAKTRSELANTTLASQNLRNVAAQARDWSTDHRLLTAVTVQTLEDILSQAKIGVPPTSFAADLLAQMERVQAADDASHAEVALDGLVVWTEARICEQPEGAVSYLNWLGIILTLLIFVYQDFSGRAMEQRLNTHLLSAEQRLLKALEQREPQTRVANLFMTTRRLHLRKLPTREASSIRVLPANRLVEKTGQEGDWFEVEVFDYLTGRVERGWMYRRYLISVEVTSEE